MERVSIIARLGKIDIALPAGGSKYSHPMDGDSSTTAIADQALAGRILAGDLDALGSLQKRLHSTLRARLLTRNIAPSEVDDLLSDLWGDCVPPSEGDTEIMAPEDAALPQDKDAFRGSGRRCLLEKYNGKSPLQSFLFTVAYRRFLDRWRRKKNAIQASACDGEGDRTSFIHSIPDPDAVQADSFLVENLLASFRAAIDACPNDAWLAFQLVYQHRISQRDAGALWGWREYETSRRLKEVRDGMKSNIESELARRDPHLNLQWDEILEICRTLDLSFLSS